MALCPALTIRPMTLGNMRQNDARSKTSSQPGTAPRSRTARKKSAWCYQKVACGRSWIRYRLIAGLVRTGLAAEEHEVMKAGGKTIEIVRIRITEAGRRAIEG